MQIIYGVIALLASVIGSVSGIGGGVIIKPVLDSIGTMDVRTVSFLSGCTVLAMAFSTFIRNSKSNVKVNYKISVYLGLGASAGGFAGKLMVSGCGNYLAVLQSVLLLLVNIGVMVFVINKAKIKMHQISSPLVCIVIGFMLGGMSSFLGIGGGPVNIAVLLYFFSMPPKESATNSLFIILLAQITSIATTIFSDAVPAFNWTTLVIMSSGGILGAIVGGRICSGIDDNKASQLFKYLLVVLIWINIYNVIKFI